MTLHGITGNDRADAEPTEPTVEVEERLLLEFLEWFARETGRQLVFADDDVRSLASTIRVFGSVRKLAPEEALLAVMAATSLSFQLSEGVVRVSTSESN